MADVRFAIKKYLDEGWSVIPIPYGSKAPEIKDWVNRTFTLEDFAENSNVGVRLGEPSGHLTDVDLDCPEAVQAAAILLPETERKHGRPTAGTSHYFYICEGAKSEKWCDVDGKVLVEIRSTGGQTVIPPSVHPSGDVLFWASERTPASIELHPLRHSCRSTATGALMGRHWPGKGSRHACASHLAGFLAARDLDIGTICAIVKAACTIAGDLEEIEDRVRAASDTVNKFADGAKIAGGPSLEDHVGKDVIALLSKWYGGNAAIHEKLVQEMNDLHFFVRVGKDLLVATLEEDELVLQKEHALYMKYSNQKVKVGEKKTGEPILKTRYEIWRENPKRRDYRRLVFSPPPLHSDPRDYNIWTGFATMPLRPTPEEQVEGSIEGWRAWADAVCYPKCRLYLEMVRDVICSGNLEHYNYLIKLLAFTVQNPGIPSEVAVVMKGGLGTGKGTFVRVFGKIFGRHFIHLDRTEQLAGKFNASISGMVFVFADEAFFAGDKTSLGSLKRLITEPTLSIERKGIDPCPEKNCIHLFMATNNDFAHQAGFKERRFLTLQVSDKHQQDHKYFGAINKEMYEGEGIAALLSYLLTREVTHEDIRHVPRTDELRYQQEQSLDPPMLCWRDKLYAGKLDGGGEQETEWPETLEPDVVYNDYLQWCDQMKINRRITMIDLFRRVLDPWLKARRKRRGTWVRPLLPLIEARGLFDLQAGTMGSWPGDGEVEDGQKDQGPDAPRKELPF